MTLEKSRRHALTLVELLVVIGIISILPALARASGQVSAML
jgi:prepilin-type N-terminal cleavage/methylation domain-containing protein